MKKIMLLILCLLLMVGCTNNENNLNDDNGNENNHEDVTLKDPKLEWCKLYNPNGFDTITCVVSNPNKVDIDITYDLVFYKDGKEVDRKVEWANFQISPKHNDVIWGNTYIPKAVDVDEVKMENIKVFEAYNKSIDTEIKHIGITGNKDYFSIKSVTKPTVNNVWVFLYNDKNNNKKCEKDELIVTSIYSTFEQEDKIGINTDVIGSKYGIDYNEYEIYYNAY